VPRKAIAADSHREPERPPRRPLASFSRSDGLRILLLAALHRRDDQPLGQLRRIVKRDYEGVNRACEFLAAIGLVSLQWHRGEDKPRIYVALTDSGRISVEVIALTVELPLGFFGPPSPITEVRTKFEP
jgi:hypothetical protein